MSPTEQTDFTPISDDQLAAVSGGTSQADQLNLMMQQLSQSIQAMQAQNNGGMNQMMPMLMMMMMMGGGGGGGGYYGAPAYGYGGAATYINIHAHLPSFGGWGGGGCWGCCCKGW